MDTKGITVGEHRIFSKSLVEKRIDITEVNIVVAINIKIILKIAHGT
jgi:hypothetical protein|tara:strand:- start:748 stop:888 length:141 start_codon:yes stop_codon:yes gene_type:complete